ncbi:MAG: hypothetical protein IT525_08775 [Nitrosomonas sp.]|nr:hypothetical protein [Nitrosomonas sp.]
MAPYCRDFFCEFDASVQGWVNHARFADSWGLRRHVLRPFRIKPGDLRQKNRVPLRGTDSEQHPGESAFSAPVRSYSMGDEHNTRKPIWP